MIKAGLAFLVTLSLVLTGCIRSVQYIPTLTFPQQTDSLPLKARYVPLVDASPPEDKEQGSAMGKGLSATSQETMRGDMGVVLNKALRDYFLVAHTFESLEG